MKTEKYTSGLNYGWVTGLSQIILSELSVMLCVLRVKPILTSIQLHFNAEFAEADAEIAEKKLSENMSNA